MELLAVQCTADGLAGALAAETRRGFDVTRELPLRAVLFQLAPDHHVLAITLHHIAADGWSLAPLAQDLSLAYNALAAGTDTPLAPLPVQYADYTLWQRDELGSEDDPASAISRQLEFWTRELRGAPEELRLPFDFSRGAQGAAEPASSVPLTIRPETGARLNALAREHNASLFMVLQAALAALLTKSGAGEDIPLGTPVAGRTDTQLNELVGFFVNTLVLRTNTSGNPTAAELVESVRYTNLHAYANQDAPFERVVEELNPARSQHRHPLFQVMLTLQNTAAAGLSMDGLEATADLSQEPGGAKFDLLLDLAEEDAERPGGIRGSLAYNPALFTRATAEQLVAGFLAVVEQFAADPGITLDRLRIQSPEQHRLALEQSLRTGDSATGRGRRRKPSSTPSGPPWPGRPTRRRSSTPPVPDAGASFGRLHGRVQALAKGLVASGVEPGDRVAVALPRTADVVAAALAVLAAGAVYIPVDLSYPEERIRIILEDGAPAVVISGAPARRRPRPRGSADPGRRHAAGSRYRRVRRGPGRPPPGRRRPGLRALHLRFHRTPQGRGRPARRPRQPVPAPPPHPVRPAVRGRRAGRNRVRGAHRRPRLRRRLGPDALAGRRSGAPHRGRRGPQRRRVACRLLPQPRHRRAGNDAVLRRPAAAERPARSAPGTAPAPGPRRRGRERRAVDTAGLRRRRSRPTTSTAPPNSPWTR